MMGSSWSTRLPACGCPSGQPARWWFPTRPPTVPCSTPPRWVQGRSGVGCLCRASSGRGVGGGRVRRRLPAGHRPRPSSTGDQAHRRPGRSQDPILGEGRARATVRNRAAGRTRQGVRRGAGGTAPPPVGRAAQRVAVRCAVAADPARGRAARVGCGSRGYSTPSPAPLIHDGCSVVEVAAALGAGGPGITLSTYAHLWPKPDDRIREATVRCGASTTPSPNPTPTPKSARVEDSLRTDRPSFGAKGQVRALFLGRPDDYLFKS